MAIVAPATVEEFAAHLNLDAAPSEGTTEHGELLLHLNAATRAIENRVGPLVNREITERVLAHRGTLVLNSHPVVSAATVTGVVGAVNWAVADLHVDASGVVSRNLGGTLPPGVYDVVYTAGRGTQSEVPEHLKLAVLITAAHLYETQRGTGVGRGSRWGAQDDTSDVPRGFALPRRALELISGDEEVAFA